jgi:hypothetical protein
VAARNPARGSPPTRRAIAIDLRDEHYGHLVIEVDNPEREIERIQQAAAGVPA